MHPVMVEVLKLVPFIWFPSCPLPDRRLLTRILLQLATQCRPRSLFGSVETTPTNTPNFHRQDLDRCNIESRLWILAIESPDDGPGESGYALD